MYSSKPIANYFLDKGDEHRIGISPMKVIKLCYVAHGWHLAFADIPLIDETVEAWPHGPVFPSLYHTFKDSGYFPIEKRAKEWQGLRLVICSIDDTPATNSFFETKPFLEKMWDMYGNWEATELSALTHQKGTPWYTVTYSPDYKGRRTIIGNDLIHAYYKKKLDEQQQRREET